MGVIDDFISNYTREIDYYQEVSRLCAVQCETGIVSRGIRAIVSFRAKRLDRLEQKIRQRDKETKYQSIDEIHSDIGDLAGTRIALYFPADRAELDSFIKSQFIVEKTKEFPKDSNNDLTPTYKKRFSGYWASHYIVKLRSRTLNPDQIRYTNTKIEIQVASLLMHAWSEVEHDLVYKPLSGELSETELSILDELNGIVIAGEIALERLQKAIEDRIKSSRAKFSNNYELAAFLFEAIRQMGISAPDDKLLGRVDYLYDILKRTNLDRPDKLQPYIKAISIDTENRPIADQIADEIMKGNSSVYKSHLENLLKTELFIPKYQQLLNQSIKPTEALGKFINKWIELEKLVADRIPPQKGRYANLRVPTYKLLKNNDIFREDIRKKYEQLRQFRNSVVHGAYDESLVDAEAIQRKIQDLEELISDIKQMGNGANK